MDRRVVREQIRQAKHPFKHTEYWDRFGDWKINHRRKADRRERERRVKHMDAWLLAELDGRRIATEDRRHETE